jgi:hypothetical protein
MMSGVQRVTVHAMAVWELERINVSSVRLATALMMLASVGVSGCHLQ